ncbi:MAG: prepilin-type N-terminal cleavage/methylation domain-containing protein [Magnetococcales bacterium]|nr:prepilin-type N-terminal cleavage/methylation domain-containing protein [Magnetococcales bacterium]NGZ28946.1 prepilin-type N-terminal cleavage/methylation domain-containing protein [Magnetococcales bacterium]
MNRPSLIFKKSCRGFTLMELVVAMVVVVILATLAIPVYNQHVIKSRRGDAYATLQMVALAQEQWRAEHTTYGSLANVWPQGVSKGGYYTIAISNVTATTFMVTATPAANSSQLKDTSCLVLQLDQNGPVVVTNAQKTCWNK